MCREEVHQAAPVNSSWQFMAFENWMRVHFCQWIEHVFSRVPKNSRFVITSILGSAALYKIQHHFELLFPLLYKADLRMKQDGVWCLGTPQSLISSLAVAPDGQVVAWQQHSLPSAYHFSLAHSNCSLGTPAFPLYLLPPYGSISPFKQGMCLVKMGVRTFIPWGWQLLASGMAL